MSKFVVAIFPDVPSAQEGISALKDLASEDAIHLHPPSRRETAENSRCK
jgi:hypothetical protein